MAARGRRGGRRRRGRGPTRAGHRARQDAADGGGRPVRQGHPGRQAPVGVAAGQHPQGVLRRLAQVFPVALRTQATRAVPRRVFRLAVAGVRGRGQEHPNLGIGLWRLPQVGVCARGQRHVNRVCAQDALPVQHRKGSAGEVLGRRQVRAAAHAAGSPRVRVVHRAVGARRVCRHRRARSRDSRVGTNG